MKRYKMGVTATDETSGMTGKIIAFADTASSGDRYLIQPKVREDGAVPDAMWVDACDLVTEDEQKVEIDRSFAFELGAIIVDRTTKAQGRIRSRIEYKNGCHHYAIKASETSRDGAVVTHRLAEDEVELVKNPENTTKAKTGGPATKGLPAL